MDWRSRKYNPTLHTPASIHAEGERWARMAEQRTMAERAAADICAAVRKDVGDDFLETIRVTGPKLTAIQAGEFSGLIDDVIKAYRVCRDRDPNPLQYMPDHVRRWGEKGFDLPTDEACRGQGRDFKLCVASTVLLLDRYAQLLTPGRMLPMIKRRTAVGLPVITSPVLWVSSMTYSGSVSWTGNWTARYLSLSLSSVGDNF